MQKITCAAFLVCYLAIVGYHAEFLRKLFFNITNYNVYC